jgi:vacuole morphology and inheritance protein 14
MNCEDVYCCLSEILLQESNLKFARLMVETLNTILLTSSELFTLRNRLKELNARVG